MVGRWQQEQEQEPCWQLSLQFFAAVFLSFSVIKMLLAWQRPQRCTAARFWQRVCKSHPARFL